MSYNGVADESRKKTGAKGSPKDFTPLTIPVQVTPVFESPSANILEIGESGYEAKSVSLGIEGLLADLPRNSVLPALVRVEFTLKKQGPISVYARWSRQGQLFDFNFIVITPQDKALIQRFLDSTK